MKSLIGAVQCLLFSSHEWRMNALRRFNWCSRCGRREYFTKG